MAYIAPAAPNAIAPQTTGACVIIAAAPPVLAEVAPAADVLAALTALLASAAPELAALLILLAAANASLFALPVAVAATLSQLAAAELATLSAELIAPPATDVANE